MFKNLLIPGLWSLRNKGKEDTAPGLKFFQCIGKQMKSHKNIDEC